MWISKLIGVGTHLAISACTNQLTSQVVVNLAPWLAVLAGGGGGPVSSGMAPSHGWLLVVAAPGAGPTLSHY